MNSKQRLERLEADRRHRVSTVSSDDARGRVMAKLQQLADRRPPGNQGLEIPEEEYKQHIEALRGVMQQARADYERQRKQPKSQAWLKLQRKQNRR